MKTSLKRSNSVKCSGYHLSVPSGDRKPGGGESSSSTSTPHVIALVGLPARGKTYISKKLSRYLNWIGIETKVFNLGDYRRRVDTYSNHELFNPNNLEGLRIRTQVCNEGLEDVIKWIENENGEVAVFDATNTTKDRRRLLYDRIVVEKGFKLFFVESICEDQDIIESNIRQVKVKSPDYKNKNPEDVVTDFKARIRHYEDLYETLDEETEGDYSFMKVFNAGKKILVHKHEGHIQSRIVYYLMNVQLTPRVIYLCRHGESENNVTGRIGGDSDLTERGERFSKLLGDHINSMHHKNLKVWTSWLKRTIQTSKYIHGTQERWKTLNEIDSGLCDGLTYEEIHDRYPEEFKARDLQKYSYRYPRGESYEDLIARLEPVIMELERQDSVLVISHQAVIRCLLGYYLETDEEDLPWTKIPLHTVIKLVPVAYGCEIEYIRFPSAPAANTHRPKPKIPGVLEQRFKMSVKILEEGDNDDDELTTTPSNSPAQSPPKYDMEQILLRV